ncbi:MAG: hypothetical protein R2849_19645 [Thermomicrobiales bacterium]
MLALVASELVAHGIVPTDLRVDRPTNRRCISVPDRAKRFGLIDMRGYLAMASAEIRLFLREPF